MEKGQLSAVSICIAFCISIELFIVICALYQYSDYKQLYTTMRKTKPCTLHTKTSFSLCFSHLKNPWGMQFFGGEVKNRTWDCSLEQFSWTFHSHVQYGSSSCKQMWVNRRLNAKSGTNCEVKCGPSKCPLMSLVKLPHSDLLSSETAGGCVALLDFSVISHYMVYD